MQKSILLFSLLFTLQISNAQWEGIEVPFNDVLTIWDLDAVDENTVWALGMDGNYSGNAWSISPTATFATTQDGGATWTTGALPVANNNWAGLMVSAIDANTAWVAVSSFWGGGSILKTTDGGATWETQSAFDLSVSFVSVIHFWDENKGIAIGDPKDGYFEIYLTEDGGTNWTRVPENQLAEPLFNELVSTSVIAVHENHVWFGSSIGRVFHSADFGNSWTAAVTQISSQPTYTWVEGITFQDSLVGVAHSAEYGSVPFIHSLVYTEDGGATWTKQAAEDPLFSIFQAQYIPETSILVKTSRSSNGSGPYTTSFSLDHGINWTNVDESTPIMSFEFLDNQTGWGGKFKNNDDPTQLYQFNGDPFTNIFQPFTINAELNLSPNPASDFLQVEISLEKSSSLEWKLVDINGKILNTRQLKSGDYFNETINLSTYASGIYTFLIQTEKGILAKKVVIE